MEWLVELFQERPVLMVRYIGTLIIIISSLVVYFSKKQQDKDAFDNVKPQEFYTLENQYEKIVDCDEVDVRRFLNNMFDCSDQFVILTSPTVQNKVRYVQACMKNELVEVEIAIQNQRTRLYYKICTKGECYAIFYDFINNEFEPNMAEYQLVEL